MDLLRESAEFLAVLSSGLFAGAAVYVNLVEHPARMECVTHIAVTEFPPSYRRAAVMQASLAALCLLAAVVVWLAGGSRLCLVGGVLNELAVPFMLLVIYHADE